MTRTACLAVVLCLPLGACEVRLADAAPPVQPVDTEPLAEGEIAEVARSALGTLAKVHTDAGDVPRMGVEREGETLQLPLKHTRAEIEVSGFVARATVTQTYQNPFTAPIEAIYVFPLPANSAVDDMRIVIGDRVIESEIQRRAKARATYEAAKRAGRTTALLEQERPNIFTQSVANIAPGEDIDVVISYVQDLTYDAGEYEVVFPMVVGPRFTPSGAPPMTPPVLGRGQRSGHDIAVELTLDAGHAIVDYAAPTHAVDVVETDGRLQVSLGAGDRVPNRDFVFRWRVAADEPQATVMTHRADRGGFFSLMLQPPLLDVDELVGQRELIFVVDVSGSMSGVPLALCKEAIQEALARLRPVDTFDIVTFAGFTARAFGEPVVASRGNVRQGLAFIRKAMAGGGTYMSDAVTAALAPPVAEGRHRYVFFLTDGYVGNESEIFSGAESLVRALEARGQRGRVFGLGTGSSPNRHLLDRLSEAGQGTSIYVGNREEPTQAVDRFFGLIDHPVLTDVTVDWGDLAVADVEPAGVPDLFASRPVIIHGRYTEPGAGTVTVRGTVGDREIELQLSVTLPEREEAHGALETLWARTRIAELERDLWYGPSPESEQAITDLGLDYRLVTAFTSLVAVDRSRKVGDGQPVTIEQPAADPEDVDVLMAGGRRVASAPRGKVAFKKKTWLHKVGSEGVGGGAFGPNTLKDGIAKAKLEGAFAELEARGAGIGGGGASGGEATISGALDKAAFTKVIRRRQASLKKAYESSLKNNPNLQGRIELEWTIGADGKVTAVKILSDSVGDAELARKIVRLVKRWRFPATGSVSTIRYPLVFRR